MKTVGILNVFSGKVLEESASETVSFLTKHLNTINYIVEKISYLLENEKEIASEMETFVRQFDIVMVVSDLRNNTVFKALTNICGEETLDNKKSQKFNDYRSEFCTNCELPTPVKLLTANSLKFPIIYFQRIYILKNKHIPEQFNAVLYNHLQIYAQEPKYSKIIKIEADDSILHTVEKFKTVINISIENGDEKTSHIILESSDFNTIVECELLMQEQLKGKCLGIFERNDVLSTIYNSHEAHIRQAIDNIEESLRLYGPENIFLSFNGGKDCTVLLHLYYIVLKMKYPHYKNPIFCSYVKNGNVFAEQTEFIGQCKVYFNLEIEESCVDMKQNLKDILRKKPHLKACLMGTRRTDPFSSKLNIFEFTDPDWPRIMRVSPLLEWHYSDIWDYLLFYKVPYCKLYDYGYTSLGDASNTVRNPALYYKDTESGNGKYLPAYKLLNESKEREGRGK